VITPVVGFRFSPFGSEGATAKELNGPPEGELGEIVTPTR
jgi:hypothetical protein